MTPEQFTLVLGACTAMVVAITALVVQVMAWRHQIDGRMEQLITLTRASALSEGRRIEKDAPATVPPPMVP